MSDEHPDFLTELRLLREVVASAVNHLAAGGRITRGDTLFKDLRRIHRATRELQLRHFEADPEYWKNIACNWAFFAGDAMGKVEGVWTPVLDSLLDAGASEPTSFARALAHVLGIELRESPDGGKTWLPVGAVQAELEDMMDDELFQALEQRGYLEVRDYMRRRERHASGYLTGGPIEPIATPLSRP